MMKPMNGQQTGWKASLERFWSRAGLGQLPPGDRFSSWLLTIDGIEIKLSVTPDEMGLFLRSRIFGMQRDDKDYFSTIGRIMRRNLGYMIGEKVAVRLMPNGTNAEYLVAETSFDVLHDSDQDLDELITGLVDRSLIYRRDFGSTAKVSAFGNVTLASKQQENFEPEMIFRP
jgi:hypothetical protein